MFAKLSSNDVMPIIRLSQVTVIPFSLQNGAKVHKMADYLIPNSQFFSRNATRYEHNKGTNRGVIHRPAGQQHLKKHPDGTR